MTRVLLGIFFLFYITFGYGQTVSFCAAGDILLDRGIRNAITIKHDINYPFKKISNFVNKTDLAFANLESSVALPNPQYRIKRPYSFRADTQFLNGVKYCGFDILSVANNHSFDMSQQGFIQTINFIKKYGFIPIGYCTRKKPFSPVNIVKKGIKFTFFAYEDFYLAVAPQNLNQPFACGRETPLNLLCDSIKKYSQISDWVIISIHCGEEERNLPTDRQKFIAHKLIDCGADMIIGQHPHVLESIEIYKDRLIIYSLGNFVFDNPKKNQRKTALFMCVFTKNHISNLRFLPVIIKHYQPTVANKELAKEIYSDLKKYSSEFNTPLNFQNNQIYINYNFPYIIGKYIYDKLLFTFTPNGIIAYTPTVQKIYINKPEYKMQNFIVHKFKNTLYFYTFYSKKGKKRLVIAAYDLSKKKFILSKKDVKIHILKINKATFLTLSYYLKNGDKIELFYDASMFSPNFILWHLPKNIKELIEGNFKQIFIKYTHMGKTNIFIVSPIKTSYFYSSVI